MCGRDGLLTDESFLNVFTYNGPDRIQVFNIFDRLMCLDFHEKSGRCDWRNRAQKTDRIF
jgi:hypothetical protein